MGRRSVSQLFPKWCCHWPPTWWIRNFQFERLLRYFLHEICILVTVMAHTIGNQWDSLYIQVKIHHEWHRRPKLIFPVVQFHHVIHNMYKWFTVVLLDPAHEFLRTGIYKASIVMGDVVVEFNPTEDSVVVVMLLLDRPKFSRSRNIEWNPIQVPPSGNVHLMLL